MGEGFLRLATVFAADGAVDGHHGFGTAEQRPNPFGQIIQGVAVLGEDGELAAVPMRVEHLGIVLQQARQLVPLAVSARLADFEGDLFQVAEQLDLGFEFGDGARGGRLVHNLLLGRLQLDIGSVLDLFQVVGIEGRQAVGHLQVDFVPALEKLLFPEAFLKPLAAAAQRSKNRLGRGGEPALENRQGETDSSLAAFAFEGLAPVEFLADLLGDIPVELGFGIG